MKQRIKKVVETTLLRATPQGFEYTPLPMEKKLKALLITKGVSLSLSINGGTESVLSEEENSGSSQVAPDKKQLHVDIDLNQEVIKGSIAVSDSEEEDSISVSIYFIIEEDETGR